MDWTWIQKKLEHFFYFLTSSPRRSPPVFLPRRYITAPMNGCSMEFRIVWASNQPFGPVALIRIRLLSLDSGRRDVPIRWIRLDPSGLRSRLVSSHHHHSHSRQLIASSPKVNDTVKWRVKREGQRPRPSSRDYSPAKRSNSHQTVRP